MQGFEKSRLIVVANRLPFSSMKVNTKTGSWECKISSGGLVSAFMGVRGMDMTWVGWPGEEIEEIEEQDALTRHLKSQDCVPVFLTSSVAKNYYNGFSNTLLWPLFHYIPLSMLAYDTAVAEEQWQAYVEANERFAETVLRTYREGDIVWVQVP